MIVIMNKCLGFIITPLLLLWLMGIADTSVTIDDWGISRIQEPDFDIGTCKTYYILESDSDIKDLKLRMAHEKLQTLLEGDYYALTKTPVGEADIIVDISVSHKYGAMEIPEHTEYLPEINYEYDSMDTGSPKIFYHLDREKIGYMYKTILPANKKTCYYTEVSVRVYRRNIIDDSQSINENISFKKRYPVVYEGSCIGYGDTSDYKSALDEVILYAMPLNKVKGEGEIIIVKRQMKERQDVANNLSIACCLTLFFGLPLLPIVLFSLLPISR